MIIQSWILTKTGEYLFYIQNESLITIEQENTVKNSLSALIKINLNLEKDKKDYFNSYSVAGLNLHIYFFTIPGMLYSLKQLK